MKRISLTLIATLFATLAFGQVMENQKLIELAKTYKDFMFRNEPTKSILKDLGSDVSSELKNATEFIVETITTKNKLLTNKFLSRPDDNTLKQIYIIRAINLNIREENQVDNHHLIDSLKNKEIPAFELVNNYYGMLFTGVGNKNQPFNLSKTDLKLNEYNLKDDTEKGILVLRAIEFCGTTIWGYMNIANPQNTEKALSFIKNFPKINGRPYFQYTDFYFPDFEMNIIKDKGIQSYKGYYLDKFYETLLYHLICLNEENGNESDKYDLLLGSILKERNLYRYTKYQELLEGIFEVREKE